MNQKRDFVLQTLSEKNIQFVRLWFTDVIGTLKSVSVAPAEIENAFAEGIGIDGSSIEGLTRSYEADVLAYPDPNTFQILPWDSDLEPTGRMFCEIRTPDDQPFLADPRNVLKRNLKKAADLGYRLYTHPEMEFFLLKNFGDNQDAPEPVDHAGYFDNVPGGTAHDFRRRSVLMLERLGISVEYSHHEAGRGQNEIVLRVEDALTTADNIMTFRSVVKEVAISEGVFATFMPKPFIDQPGSGMHTHFSLFEGEKNLFYEPGAEYQMSQIGRQFTAGVLHYAPEFTAITNQFVNSYKRMWGADEAPSYVCWGHNNRSALIRVPLYKPLKPQSARIEYRGLDSAANPYLAFSVILAAGLRGIEEERELPPEAEDNVWELTEHERQALGFRPLPESLDAAIDLMAESELVADTLGEHVFRYVLKNKQQEWQAYRQQVTPFELENNLRRL